MRNRTTDNQINAFIRIKGRSVNHLTLWVILWILVIVFYLPAWKGGFQRDFHGWLQTFNDLTFPEIINRKFAGITSFYQVTQLQLYFWTWLFGTRPLPWFLLFTGLHALNGALLYHFCLRLFRDFKAGSYYVVAAVGVLLFLFNPSNTEVVIWKACYHYLIAIQIVLWILIWTQRYLQTGKVLWIWLICGLFLIATLTIEIWYTIPWIILLMGAVYARSGLIPFGDLVKLVIRCVLPLLAIFVCYLLAYHHRYGGWLAHSAYVVGTKNPLLIAARLWTYEFHLLLFGRFFPYGARQWFYNTISEGLLSGPIAVITIFFFCVLAYRRLPGAGPGFRLAALFLGWSLLALLIVLHFEPERLMYVRNDRYLYFTSMFQGVLIALLLGQLLEYRPKIGVVVLGLVLTLHFVLTEYLVWQWRYSNKIFWGLQDNYHWSRAPAVLLLNLPITFNGVPMIDAGTYDEFAEHLRIFRHEPNPNNVFDVAGYNMLHNWDGAHVQVLDSNRIKVTLNQWGSWWWLNDLGAIDRENEMFKVSFGSSGHDYELTLKQQPKGMILLYSQGLQWRVVDMNKRGVEQW